MWATGPALSGLCAGAQSDLVLVAPFVKAHALERLLSLVALETQVTLVTRWRIDEVAAGISDLEVFDLLQGRAGRVLLRYDLHAKYYRGDNSILVGSANLTGAALGWSLHPNLEVLVPCTLADGLMFEAHLLTGCTYATAELVALLRDAVAKLPPTAPQQVPEQRQPGIDPTCYLPSLRNPEHLYAAYSAGGEFTLTDTERRAAATDIACLGIPPQLSSEAFLAWVQVSLAQQPIVARVEALAGKHGASFGRIRSLLEGEAGLVRAEAEWRWQTLMRWLLYFLPDKYRAFRPNYSECFRLA